MNIKPPKIPPRGRTKIRTAIEHTSYGVDFSIQIRSLDVLTEEGLLGHTTAALRAYSETANLDWDTVQYLADKFFLDPTTHVEELDRNDVSL